MLMLRVNRKGKQLFMLFCKTNDGLLLGATFDKSQNINSLKHLKAKILEPHSSSEETSFYTTETQRGAVITV